MKRRDFLSHVGAGVLAMGSGPALAAAGDAGRVSRAGWLLIPMDDRQPEHLKAYGVIYRMLQRGGRAEWLLNYRSGSFLIEQDPATQRDAALSGVVAEVRSDSQVLDVRGMIQSRNMEAIPLEKAPKIAVYVPPGTTPWDDAVRMALQFAGIEYDSIWDAEVIGGGLKDYEWLHLHHEDFTGQYSKFFLTYSGSPWLTSMVQLHSEMARRLGFGNVPDLKKAVARGIRDYVTNGGFLFGMCAATETLELALAGQDVDIAANYADGTPMDPAAAEKMQWDRSLAFHGARLDTSPSTASFSDIDGHQVNNPPLRQPLGAFKLFSFSAKIDPVPAMLVQSHRQVVPDFYGLTTSFNRNRLKPGVIELASEGRSPWVKYIHGASGKGTWTFLGGHDPEDPQHQVGDPPTDLSLHPTSPGYRLILNNVLFPAAKKRELKT